MLSRTLHTVTILRTQPTSATLGGVPGTITCLVGYLPAGFKSLGRKLSLDRTKAFSINRVFSRHY
jgi:hypothetical protein